MLGAWLYMGCRFQLCCLSFETRPNVLCAQAECSPQLRPCLAAMLHISHTRLQGQSPGPIPARKACNNVYKAYPCALTPRGRQRTVCAVCPRA